MHSYFTILQIIVIVNYLKCKYTVLPYFLKKKNVHLKLILKLKTYEKNYINDVHFFGI